MRRILLCLYALLAIPFCFAQQLQIYCDHNNAVSCTTASPATPASAWDPLWLNGGKTNVNFNQLFGVLGGSSAVASGNLNVPAPTSGTTLGVNGATGSSAEFINVHNDSGAIGLIVQGSFTGGGPHNLVTIQDTGNANGATLKLIGNGATTPSKVIKVNGGHLQVANDAYNANIFDVDDLGDISQVRTVQITTTLTVSTLPTCNTGAKGTIAAVSDASSPTYNTTLAGSGAVYTLALCNGTNWTAH